MPASSSLAPSTRSSETLIGPASPFLVTGPQSLQPENPLDVFLKCNSQHHHLTPTLLVPAPAVNYRFSDNPLLHAYLHPAPSCCLSTFSDLLFLTAGSDTHQGNPSSSPFRQPLGWGLYRNMPWASVPQPLLPCGGR